MRILMITPSYYPIVTGNAVDVERISAGLEALGHEIMLSEPDIDMKKVRDFSPEIVHGFHAYKSRVALEIAEALKVPLVITLTGTDYYRDVDEKGKKEKIMHVVKGVCAVTFMNPIAQEDALNKFPYIKKHYTIARGKPLLDDAECGFSTEGKFIFSLIGGVRPVKNNMFPIEAIERLHEKYDNMMLIFAGPILDDKYGKKFKDRIKGKSWIRYLGNVPHLKIKNLFECSDVILNCSLAESGSNAVFEAMVLGKAVLVSDIKGNYLVKNNVNGLRYTDDFYEKCKLLYEDARLRAKLGTNAKKDISKAINDNEAKDYENVYLICSSTTSRSANP